MVISLYTLFAHCFVLDRTKSMKSWYAFGDCQWAHSGLFVVVVQKYPRRTYN